MKTIFLLPFLLLSLLGAPSANAESPRAKKIQIENGRTTAVVKGTVRPGKGEDYFLSVGKGQTVAIRLKSNNKKAAMEIYDKNGLMVNEGSRPDEFEGSYNSPNELKISVGSGEAKTQYTMEVTLK